MNICKVTDCNRKVTARGYCSKHYLQIRRHGKLLECTRFDPNPIIIHKGYAEIIIKNKNCVGIARSIIDEEDIKIVSKHKWHLSNGYAKTRKSRKMHQILNPSWKITDHINGDKLDNRRSNLRKATSAENNRNRRKASHKQYKGVYKSTTKHLESYHSKLGIGDKNIYLGSFSNKILAAKAYDNAAVEYFGKFARLNFPREGYQCLTSA